MLLCPLYFYLLLCAYRTIHRTNCLLGLYCTTLGCPVCARTFLTYLVPRGYGTLRCSPARISEIQELNSIHDTPKIFCILPLYFCYACIFAIATVDFLARSYKANSNSSVSSSQAWPSCLPLMPHLSGTRKQLFFSPKWVIER